jgi:hypothetical protein
MKKILSFALLTAISLYMLTSCESCSRKKNKPKTIIKEKVDTIVVHNTKEKEVLKVVYDTIFVEVDSVKDTIKPKETIKAAPLQSWKDTKTKRRIIAFVKTVTDKNSLYYVKPSDRIAVFDQEGTLWPEKPLYFQIEFMFDRIKQMVPEHPEWKKDRIVKAALERNQEKIKKFGGEGLFRLSMLTQSNMTVKEYNTIILNWINNSKHPETGKLYKDMIYKPMVDLFSYLKENKFKIYIVTESGYGFIRPWVEQIYGIPKEQVIASRRRLKWQEVNGKHVLIRDPEILFINDKANKVISIEQIIGKRPILAFGNSDNDLFMLQWTNEGDGKNLVGIIHHTDGEREWAYDKDSKIGRLDKALTEAKDNDWVVVDMKNDWAKIYSK